MDATVDFVDIILRLLLAAVAGTILGWERESQDKPAGLRTHMMVSLGAAVFIIVSLRVMQTRLDVNEQVSYDFLRIIEGIIGGVGFLGAGVILQSGAQVKGVTTAASIWLTAAIGIACGMGYFEIAAISAVMGLVILMLFGVLESKFFPNNSSNQPLEEET